MSDKPTDKQLLDAMEQIVKHMCSDSDLRSPEGVTRVDGMPTDVAERVQRVSSPVILRGNVFVVENAPAHLTNREPQLP